MQLKVETWHIGPGSALVFDLRAPAWVIVMPGAGYTVQAPLLWFAREAALAAGRNVLAVTDTFNRGTDDPLTWVSDRAEAVLSRLHSSDPQPVLITKSMTSLAAGIAVRKRLPGIWLTPLINAQEVDRAPQIIEALRAQDAPKLLIGGGADPSWDGEVARTIDGAQILELEDADHSLQVPGSPDRSLENLALVTARIGQFLRAPQ